MSKYDPSAEYGVSGLKRYGGNIYEEFLRQLQGTKKCKTYDEMDDNDTTISGILYAINAVVKQVKWAVQPSGDSDEHKRQAKFVESCRDDMSGSWQDFISDAFTFLKYGFSYLELVYKRRMGPDQDDGQYKSKYDDGHIGWRKIPLRAQETLVDNWVFDESGGLQGVTQKAPPDWKDRWIPIEKALLFRTESDKGNPEGKSVIRPGYRPWYFKKNIQNIEAVGIERDMCGLPVMYIPSEILDPKTPEASAIKTAYQNIVTNVRRDEQEGMMLPSETDEKGNRIVELKLLSAGGSRQFDIGGTIRRYDFDIALSVLAQFIMQGTQNVGSLAMQRENVNIFTVAVCGWLDTVADIFNRFAIPRLIGLNGWDTTKCPILTHAGVKAIDLVALSTFITALNQAGVPLFPNPELEQYLMRAANLPFATQGQTDDNPESQNPDTGAAGI